MKIHLMISNSACFYYIQPKPKVTANFESNEKIRLQNACIGDIDGLTC